VKKKNQKSKKPRSDGQDEGSEQEEMQDSDTGIFLLSGTYSGNFIRPIFCATTRTGIRWNIMQSTIGNKRN
jgi:hypothetical protein